MKNKIRLLALLFFVVQSLPAQDAVTVLEDSLYSPSVQSQMRLTVLLPKNYNRGSERYTTIYLLHGFGGNYMDWTKY